MIQQVAGYVPYGEGEYKFNWKKTPKPDLCPRSNENLLNLNLNLADILFTEKEVSSWKTIQF